MGRKIGIALAFMIILCTIVGFGASAEGAINLGGDGCDQLTYVGKLNDGRVVFCGSVGSIGDYHNSRARLLCLNPDWTVSWEYIDPAEGEARYIYGAILQDDIIGVIYRNAPYQETRALEIRKFTTDGNPTDDSIDLFGRNNTIKFCNSLCIGKTIFTDDDVQKKGFLNWNGELLFDYGKREKIGFWDATVSGNDLVLAGNDPSATGNAKLMKVSMEGNTIWETLLPTLTESGVSSRIERCIQTSDGGYLGWQVETDANDSVWTYALIKFDDQGRIIWKNHDAFANQEFLGCQDLYEYNGKYVFMERRSADHTEKSPDVFYWFDADGNQIDKTELWIARDEMHVSASDTIAFFGGTIFQANEGLWVILTMNIVDDQDTAREMDSVDELVFRIPENDV